MDCLNKYNVCDIKLQINGENIYADELRKYFEEFRDTGKQEKWAGEIIINVHDAVNVSEFIPQYYSLSETIKFNKNTFLSREGRCTYWVTNLFQQKNPTVINLYWEERSLIKKTIRTILDFLSPYSIGVYGEAQRFVRAITNYSLLWYLFAIALMKYDRVFVHSGMMANCDSGIILSGTSGCGKTSTMLELLNREGWKYLAEDFGVVSRDGKLWRFPKCGAIYASDARFGNKLIAEALKGLPVVDRIRWKLSSVCGMNPVYYFKPEQIFTEMKVSMQSVNTKVVFLSRVSKECKIERINVNDMEIVDRIKNASFREIKAIYETLYNIRAVADNECRRCYPSIGELEQVYTDILLDALKCSKYYVLRIPVRANPSDIAKYIIE